MPGAVLAAVLALVFFTVFAHTVPSEGSGVSPLPEPPDSASFSPFTSSLHDWTEAQCPLGPRFSTSVYKQVRGHLIRMWILLQQVWRGAVECVFLASHQVMLMLRALGPPFA